MSQRVNKIVNHLSQTNNIRSHSITNNNDNSTKVAVIMGAGDGLGASIAKRFSKEGFIIVVARRNGNKLNNLISSIKNNGGKVHGFSVDTRKEDKISEFISHIETSIGPIHFACYNPGANVYYNILSTTSRVYRKVWEMANFGGFLFAKEVLKYMSKRKTGCIIFTGASASLRGKKGFSAFSSAKSGLRMVAQSCAREYGPKGIHIAHIVIDGPIDGEFIRNLMKRNNNNKINNDTFGDRNNGLNENGLMKPDDIAENYWNIYKQNKSAWTFEMDLRPYSETW